MRKFLLSMFLLLGSTCHWAVAQQSVARQWNELMLDAIRHDFARPTIHARNLFHASIAMYEAWTAYDATSEHYLLGKTKNGVFSAFDGIPIPSDISTARNEAISFAAYRLLTYRFRNSPGAIESLTSFDQLMDDLGYDKNFTDTDYSGGDAAALGNYIAQVIIDYGKVDGSNEQASYANQFYKPINTALVPTEPGNPNCENPNRWQPLALETFIDQSGHVFPGSSPPFLGPEWGSVFSFAFKNSDKVVYDRDGHDYNVFLDPSAPPYLNQTELTEESKAYQWSFSLVSIWSGHLDPTDGVMIDISPASIGNNPAFPETFYDYPDFYNLLEGGDQSRGHALNPVTNQPYAPQIVPRGDYTRVLAEFWADGPSSETPPGHWFTILNYVSDHPMVVKKFKGEGEVLDDLEWDVKAYFTLGGTVHDAAVSAWGVKGWYDYIRPVSAIRYMADHGQSSDPNLPNFHIEGIPLVEGEVELVEEGDPLVGANNENVNKIKVMAWKGHSYIANPDTDNAGVDWILAENWWPYQRPSFVTPPFAGYVSGHSTFSRAAAEVMTLLTGDAYFPGGMGVFDAPKDEFLVFENGPSVDLELQWATYRDASDQCSLSRIWGGIHPPADDMPGRKMGVVIGHQAFAYAERHFTGTVLSNKTSAIDHLSIYPNPVSHDRILKVVNPSGQSLLSLIDMNGQLVKGYSVNALSNHMVELDLYDLQKGIYILKIGQVSKKIVLQ